MLLRFNAWFLAQSDSEACERGERGEGDHEPLKKHLRNDLVFFPRGQRCRNIVQHVFDGFEWIRISGFWRVEPHRDRDKNPAAPFFSAADLKHLQMFQMMIQKNRHLGGL